MITRGLLAYYFIEMSFISNPVDSSWKCRARLALARATAAHIPTVQTDWISLEGLELVQSPYPQ
jgi:hypothetical protein